MSEDCDRSVLLLGGARSGKSRLALRMVEERGLPGVYCATGLPTDEEMEARIHRHRAERGERWTTIEAPFGFAAVLGEDLRGKGLVVDCVTLLLANLFFREKEEEKTLALFREECAALLAKRKREEFLLLLVSNEVGLGVVPASWEGRAFRDLQGWANQWLAQQVDEVYFLLAGIPWKLK